MALVATPLFLRTWRDYERANARARSTYYAGTGQMVKYRDQAERVRKTKQVR